MPSGHIDPTKPLRPLTKHAWEVLGVLNRRPIAAYEINAGVRDRLMREELIDISTDQRRTVSITEAGRAKWNSRP